MNFELRKNNNDIGCKVCKKMESLLIAVRSILLMEFFVMFTKTKSNAESGQTRLSTMTDSLCFYLINMRSLRSNIIILPTYLKTNPLSIICLT